MKIYIPFFFFAFIIAGQILAQDTFSIIAVDEETGEIGAAGATCVDGIAQFGGIQLLNKIIPGRGGVNAQAWICLNPHINLDNAIGQMNMGLNPDEIIDWLQNNDECSSQNFNPEYRQYGVVDFDASGNARTAGFTGANADDYKGHLLGANYAIQGNILLGPEILQNMEEGFNSTDGSLAEKLMAAMQGANIPGADSRCLDRGTSSTTAFLRVVRPNDVFGDHYLELSILEMPFGEEPIDSLQSLFDDWLETVSPTQSVENNRIARLFPNPAQGSFLLDWEGGVDDAPALSVIDVSGKQIIEVDVNSGQNHIKLPTGIMTQLLFVQVKNKAGETLFAKKILAGNE